MPKQILLVEDSITMQKVVEITFAHEDYRITSAKDADEALLRLNEIRPDIILCDAGLPGRSGYDLCAQLKADGATRDIPFLLLTGNFNPYDEVRGQRCGVDAHVVKPFETQVLIDKVADLLRRRSGAPAPQPVQTLVSMPVMQVPSSPAVGAVAAAEGRRPTIPPQPPRVSLQPSSMPSRPPAEPARSTLMGIPAVNPLGAAGLRPPPPPGMRVRETGNLPAINPPGPSGVPGSSAGALSSPASALPSWGRPTTAVPSQATPVSPVAQAQAMQMPPAAGDRTTVVGIPSVVPQMPRPSLIPRAPIPAPVLATLERIAKKGAEYEAIAKLSMEVIEQVVWEVVPELAEVMIRAEVERLGRERQS
ncbi:MAG: response regulator [Myxococcales bacterium]|nr:response regulator [Myxococcota bacterium]MDW8280807.1 response regulator [Myxococcales bacterium]